MSGHTPGPWAVQCDPLHFHTMSTVVGGEMCSGFPDRRLIVEVGGSAPPNEQEANARLIAAAPDLLSIAQRWRALDAGGWHQDRHEAEKRQLLNETIDAIAKATQP